LKDTSKWQLDFLAKQCDAMQIMKGYDMNMMIRQDQQQYGSGEERRGGWRWSAFNCLPACTSLYYY
jgi:hypothetical protein